MEMEVQSENGRVMLGDHPPGRESWGLVVIERPAILGIVDVAKVKLDRGDRVATYIRTGVSPR